MRRIIIFILFSFYWLINYGCSESSQIKVKKRTEVSQYGITWTFEEPALTGQFITGDWWVTGPVRIVKINPAPGPAVEEEINEIKMGRWGDTSLKLDKRMRNGSMIVERCSGKHSYDSRITSFDSSLSITVPLDLKPDQSLISTISNPNLRVDHFCRDLMVEKEKKVSVCLNTAAILTCLNKKPARDAFRPSYVGNEKRIYREKDIRWDRLCKLKPPAGDLPSWAEVERYFQRPWLDHITNWTIQQLYPNENQPSYGREVSRLVSIASMMLQLDVPDSQKRKLLTGFIQYGIDLSGCAKSGGVWNMGGGHSSGRKWPIIFSSILLDKPEIRELPESAVFHEDTQTYYGKGWFGQTTLWYMVVHHGKRDHYEEKPPEQWLEWDRNSEGYRLCCNAGAWIGTALAARYMKAIKIWGHDAYFDYADRWMMEDDPYKENRGKHPRPAMETKALDPFITNMWKEYRKTAPEQEMSGNHLMWEGREANHGKWVPNPKP